MAPIEVNSDLHLHGQFSGAVSADMVPSRIGEQAILKGLHLVGTADILNDRWLRMVKDQLSQEAGNEGVFIHKNGTRFILQTEIEDAMRVHHILLFPSLSKVQEVRERFSSKCKDLDTEGRPKIHLNSAEIADIALAADCLVGPSHAFTPWTAMYKEYNSLEKCYGSNASRIAFIELGLSADTDMADRVSELGRVTFLSNSDAHSPWPNKMGREFTTLSMEGISFSEMSKAIKREGGRRPILNVKLSPKEGKYHRTRCMGCLTFFTHGDAMRLRWRCPACGKPIKKGVLERIDELASSKEPVHPDHRPPCVHIIPLSEIIGLSLGVKNVYSAKVQEMWRLFINKFRNEISVLTTAPISELESVDKRTAEMIRLFREDKFSYIPGGAGEYGVPVPPGKDAKMKVWDGAKVVTKDINATVDSKQRSLSEFL
ncbi:Uncharacterised protein [uncultured archaeon]|nr:Uncharacterised protein [uncultured archaeon]